MGREEQIINERLRKIKELKEQKINPYPHKFDVKNYARGLQEKYSKLKPDAKKKDSVRVAGRLMSIRDLGKIAFGVLKDSSGEIQITLQEKETKEDVRKFFKKFVDSGDIVGVEGMIFRTKRGELSVLVKKLDLLSKSMLPLPAKWHGLQDKEERYRKRYLDLIMQPEVMETFVKRQKIINLTRDFLIGKGFNEVETPLLQPLYGGAEAQPFITKLNALDMPLYMSISPEIYLKKLLVGGMDRVFTICKNFRNEGIDKSHNPEFTMMEAYASYWDYNDVMKMTEQLLEMLAKKITGKTNVSYQGKEIDFKAPFKVLRIEDAIKKYAGIDPCDDAALLQEVQKLNFMGTRDEMIQFLFDERVEKHLIQPIFIIDYPKSICPLTKEHRRNLGEVERFELFVNGMELANAYSELNDPIEQEKRLKEQLRERKKSGKFQVHLEANELDEDFVNAMKHGMPPAGGIGIGIDRLVMFLTDSASIRDVILFPFMKPLDSKKTEAGQRSSFIRFDSQKQTKGGK
ncbi:MAG: lysine--tRNA ligase [Nanoarchaeota archaeon]